MVAPTYINGKHFDRRTRIDGGYWDMPVDQMNQNLGGALKNQGERVLKYCQKHNLDPMVALLVIRQETDFEGKPVNSYAARQKNNYTGYCGAGGPVRFRSMDEGLDKGLGLLAKHAKSCKTFEKLQPVYCPTDEQGATNDGGYNRHWLAGIERRGREMVSAVGKFLAAAGHIVVAGAKAVVNAGGWVYRHAASALTPSPQAVPHATPHMPPVQTQGYPHMAQTHGHVPPAKPALVHGAAPDPRVLKVNPPAEPVPPRAGVVDTKPEARPRL